MSGVAKVTRRRAADNLCGATLEVFVESTDPHLTGVVSIIVDGQRAVVSVPCADEWQGSLAELAELFRDANTMRRAHEVEREAERQLAFEREMGAEYVQLKAGLERHLERGECPTCAARDRRSHVVTLRLAGTGRAGGAP